MNKERESNFEVLKIISIMLIISFHYVYKSGYNFEVMNMNSFLIKIFYFFGELGVNLFALITGYFMIKKEISIKKIILLILEVFFYNLLNVFLCFYVLKVPIKIADIFFPIIYNRYWFLTVYIIIYILSPYINKLILNMSKKEFRKLLITVLLIWSFIPTIFGLNSNSTETLLYYSRFIWLIIMYFIGAYINLYDIETLNTKKKSFIMSISTFLIMTLSIFFIYHNKFFLMLLE